MKARLRNGPETGGIKMANDPFDFSDVFAEIENKVADVMQSSQAGSVLREVMALSAQSNVYGAYTPTMYERRHTMDNSIAYKVDASGNTMTVENILTEERVFDIVESGSGYTWTKSQIYKMQPFPRQYTQQGIDQFVDDWLMPEIERQISSK